MAEFHDIEAGPDELTIALRTIRLNRRIAVTHKHRFGSCEGTLIATPAGLRYETRHTEDAFAAPLTGIGTFEADYLQRNLKVGMPGGRNWNFTVPDGRADDLYAFYQDVEKVRQRLIDLRGFDDARLLEPITDTRHENGKGVTRYVLLHGLVQHHACHSGQIAILAKF